MYLVTPRGGMRTRIAWTAALFVLFAPKLPAQAVITGFVRDSAGRALGEVEVLLDGSKAKTRTDTLGRYSLSAPAGAYTVLFRLIGYQERKETVTLTVPDTLLFDTRLIRARAAKPDGSPGAHAPWTTGRS